MISDSAEQVLREIFGASSGWATGEFNKIKMCPGFDDMHAIAGLLHSAMREEDLQAFLAERPQFLMGLFGNGDDSDAAFVTKPPIGNRYNADFAVLNISQGGCRIVLIELEPANVPLFTSKNTPARRLQSAMGQVRDWHEWVRQNVRTFTRDLVDHVKTLPEFPNRASNWSFCLRDTESLERAWAAFGGFKDPEITYAIVIGRWSLLSEEHRGRLAFLNRQDKGFHSIFTYDQLARKAYQRPARWF